ncbi:hypothetical protein CL656_07230 [bacterium]|nr:hypothetical protein [bacterium]|tara:strand:+ start:161 stop:688 length:528 start_codon:yes stop_codon:yes gene_type:complete
MNTLSKNINTFKVINKWNFYIHYSDNKSWDLNSYIHIISINDVTQAILFEEQLSSKMIQNCMIFIMKDGINPTWEDPKNINGGSFSYKINNKVLYKVFKLVYFSLITNNLTPNKGLSSKINGITISPKNTMTPKKNFSILKIWIENCNYIDPDMIYPLEGLERKGCIFRKHNPDK